MSTALLVLDPKAASFEDFGDEIVVIHNDSGVFYSLKGRAMAVWRGLADGVDPMSIDRPAPELAPEEVETIQRMLAELTAKAIIVSTERATAASPLQWRDLGPARFESNSDFDDLIRLDPIHDVSDSGWPHKKTDSK